MKKRVEELAVQKNILCSYKLNVFYGTQTGTAKLFANELASEVEQQGVTVSVSDLKDCDPEECLVQEVSWLQN